MPEAFQDPSPSLSTSSLSLSPVVPQSTTVVARRLTSEPPCSPVTPLRPSVLELQQPCSATATPQCQMPSAVALVASYCSPMLQSLQPTLSSPCIKSQTGSQTMLEFMSINQGIVKISDELAILVTTCNAPARGLLPSSLLHLDRKLGRKIKARSVKESGRDAPKPLDLVSNDIILSSLRSSGKVIVMASEEDEEPV